MKTFIIYDRNHELSTRLFREAKASVKSFDLPCYEFDAIVGKEVDRFFQTNDLHIASDGDMRTNRGTRGCFVSHYQLWKKCVDLDEPFIVLEHDAVMIEDPRKIEFEVEDVCHLDAHIPFNDGNNEYFHRYNELVLEKRKGVSVHFPNNFYGNMKETGSCFMGAYGYMLKPKGAIRLIEFVHNYGARPADKCICEKVVTIQRSNQTYVRLNPFFRDLNIQRQYTTRK